jgi:hypothetical protein
MRSAANRLIPKSNRHLDEESVASRADIEVLRQDAPGRGADHGRDHGQQPDRRGICRSAVVSTGDQQQRNPHNRGQTQQGADGEQDRVDRAGGPTAKPGATDQQGRGPHRQKGHGEGACRRRGPPVEQMCPGDMRVLGELQDVEPENPDQQ